MTAALAKVFKSRYLFALILLLTCAAEFSVFTWFYRDTICIISAYTDSAAVPIERIMTIYDRIMTLIRPMHDVRISYYLTTILLRKGKTDEAIRLLERLSADQPDNLMLRYQLAIELFNRGRYAEAEQHFRDLLAAANKNGRPDPAMPAWQQLFDLEKFMLQSRPLTAHARQSAEQTSAPNSADLYRFLGYIAWQQNDPGRTIECFKQVQILLPADKDAALYLALANRRLKDYPQSIAWFKRVLEIDSSDLQARFDLALTLAEGRQYDQALPIFREIYRHYPQAREPIISILVMQKRFSETIVFLNELLSQEPGNARLQYELARLYSWNGEYDKSAELYRRLLKEHAFGQP